MRGEKKEEREREREREMAGPRPTAVRWESIDYTDLVSQFVKSEHFFCSVLLFRFVFLSLIAVSLLRIFFGRIRIRVPLISPFHSFISIYGFLSVFPNSYTLHTPLLGLQAIFNKMHDLGMTTSKALGDRFFPPFFCHLQ